MLPAVWVPNATGNIPSATPAADPDEEPPGVCPGLAGLAVGPGLRVANSVVTVLPITTPPVRAGPRHGCRVRPRPPPVPDRRTIRAGHIAGIQHIFNSHRNAVQLAWPRHGGPGGGRIVKREGVDDGLAFGVCGSRQASMRSAGFRLPAAICRAASVAVRRYTFVGHGDISWAGRCGDPGDRLLSRFEGRRVRPRVARSS